MAQAIDLTLLSSIDLSHHLVILFHSVLVLSHRLAFHLDIHFVVLIFPVFIVRDLPPNCLILAPSLLLILAILVDNLHHSLLTVLGIYPIISVDVLLDVAASEPPLHKENVELCFAKIWS